MSYTASLLYMASSMILYCYINQNTSDSKAQEDSMGIQSCGQTPEQEMWIFLAGLRGVRESTVMVGDNKFLRVGDGECEPADTAKEIKPPSPGYKSQNIIVPKNIMKMPLNHEVPYSKYNFDAYQYRERRNLKLKVASVLLHQMLE
jgi:hypothetical protein